MKEGYDMNIIADTHCHTLASSHAYSTLYENIKFAKKNGIKILAITDHGTSMPDSPHIWHFHNYKVIPREVEGVKILYGVEANICDYQGNIDVDNSIVPHLDWIVASYHEAVCKPSTVENHNKGYIELCKNPYVDVIGHSGNGNFLYDYQKIIKIFKEYNKIVEINENSLACRKNSNINCLEIAKLCKKYETMVVVNSDAHIASQIGLVPNSMEMLESINFPKDLILNLDYDKFVSYINNKRDINLN